MFCNTKDRVPGNLKEHVICVFSRPVCNAGYIGKTDQNFSGLDKNSLIFNDIIRCSFNQYYYVVFYLSISEHIKIAATDNIKIIGKTEKWVELAFCFSYILIRHFHLFYLYIFLDNCYSCEYGFVVKLKHVKDIRLVLF